MYPQNCSGSLSLSAINWGGGGGTKVMKKTFFQPQPLVKDCHFGVSPINHSDFIFKADLDDFNGLQHY